MLTLFAGFPKVANLTDACVTILVQKTCSSILARIISASALPVFKIILTILERQRDVSAMGSQP